MNDLLLIEIEGVLADLRAPRLDALRSAVEAAGIPISEATADAATEREDGGDDRGWIRAVLARAGRTADDVAVDLIAARADRDLASRVSIGLTLAPGARDFLEDTAAQAHVVIVTRLSRAVTDGVLATAGFADLTTTVLTADDVLDRKPSIEGYRSALARLEPRRTAGHRAIALEGSRAGIRAARAAGLPVVAVGRISPDQAMEADGYVESLVGQTLQSLHEVVAGSPGASQ